MDVPRATVVPRRGDRITPQEDVARASMSRALGPYGLPCRSNEGLSAQQQAAEAQRGRSYGKDGTHGKTGRICTGSGASTRRASLSRARIVRHILDHAAFATWLLVDAVGMAGANVDSMMPPRLTHVPRGRSTACIASHEHCATRGPLAGSARRRGALTPSSRQGMVVVSERAKSVESVKPCAERVHNVGRVEAKREAPRARRRGTDVASAPAP